MYRRIENGGIEIITDAGTTEVKTAQAEQAAETVSEKQNAAPAAENVEIKNVDELGQCTQVTYSVKGLVKNFDDARIGDRVKLPAFTVPEATMQGRRRADDMEFEEQHIPSDYAIVVDKRENGDLILVFDHCIFNSAVDNNNETIFYMTQLGQYLNSVFLTAMKDAGIPAESCGLISKEEMFGDNALKYFKIGRNRIAFDFYETYSRWYWLSTTEEVGASAACFCYAGSYGNASYDYASYAHYYVRPRFIIRKS